MSRNQSGNYTLPLPPVSPGDTVEAQWANLSLGDIGDALTQSLDRNGRGAMLAPLILSSNTPTQSLEAVSKAFVESKLVYATGMPIASVCPFASLTAPVGWLKCDGLAVSRTAYPELFGIIGTTYGAGDGSTTFNLPNLVGEFIRGTPVGRDVGSKQAGSFAAHTHPVSDPGHTHGASQAAHSHVITTGSHSHGVNDPGHSHSKGFDITGGFGVNAATAGSPWQTNTGASGTGISIQSAGNLGGNTDNQQPAVTVASSTTGETIGATGGTETVPQNIAMDYYIKALPDASGIQSIVSISSTDPNMISVDETNPATPVLAIHSNVAFGTVKLDANNKVPLALLPAGNQTLLGYWDASGGQTPSEADPLAVFHSGDTFILSVGGTLDVYNPVTLVSSPTTVTEGSFLIYIADSLSDPTGWYYQVAATTTTAAQVQYANGGTTLLATNVQDAITELNTNAQSAATVPYVDAQDAILEQQITNNFALTVKQDSESGAASIPSGSTAERPDPVQIGAIRFNEDTNVWEGWSGFAWVLIANTGTPVDPPIVSGTRMLFAQPAAPDGWTQDVSDAANNRMLRVVNTAGGGIGGSNDPILMNVVPAHTHGYTTGTVSAWHTHSGNTGDVSADHTHGIGDPGHAHSEQTMGGSGGWAWGTGGAIVGATTGASGTGIWTGGASANHFHGFNSGDPSANHTHAGGTDNGSSQTNWTPRYNDLIICQKD